MPELPMGIPSISASRPAAETVEIDGDPRLLTRAIGNLVENSIKHNPQGCAIMLTLDCTEASLALTVADNGVGLSAEAQRNFAEKPHLYEQHGRPAGCTAWLRTVDCPPDCGGPHGNAADRKHGESGLHRRLILSQTMRVKGKDEKRCPAFFSLPIRK